MKLKKIVGGGLILVGVGVAAWAGVSIYDNFTVSPAPSPLQSAIATPLWQAESLIPTAQPKLVLHLENPQEIHSTFLPDLRSVPSGALERFGVGVPYPPLTVEVVQKLDLGWYLAWQVLDEPARPHGLEFWQMIRLQEDEFRPDKTTIRQVARTNPGTIWLIGNEPDVIWQDNVTPSRYAEWYHELYHLLKMVDPTCQVAIGGVTQPTPLRLQYLDAVLLAYQNRYNEPMPVDLWNVHNFILREERNSWGVDIPPGFSADQGILYEIEDHDNLEIFKTQLIQFRQWMARHNQRHKALIVSEYGILMPNDYGFGPERVQYFLYKTYQFMLTAQDPELGYPADDNRLVQRWVWYSLSDNRYPTGNFIDFTTGELTPVGQAHQEFVIRLP